MTRAFVREFSESEVAPRAAERDEQQKFDRFLFNQMASLGLAAIPINDEYGGAGGDWLTFAVAVEELARVCASSAAGLAAHTVFAAWPVYAYGNKRLKEAYLGGLSSGQLLGASVLPSIIHGGKVSQHNITYTDESDESELNGSHDFVLQAEPADLLLVFAQSGKRQRKGNCSAFLIEAQSSGVLIGKGIPKIGHRSIAMSAIQLDHCLVSSYNRVVKEKNGDDLLRSLSVIAQISAAAQAVGIAQGAYEAAAAYAVQRKQFGVLIGKQQGISFKLADMWTQLEAARLLTYQAAWRRDMGLSCSREAAIARKYSAACAVAVSIEAIQIFGGYGYMEEYRLERFLRDAKCLESAIGTGGAEWDSLASITLA